MSDVIIYQNQNQVETISPSNLEAENKKDIKSQEVNSNKKFQIPNLPSIREIYQQGKIEELIEDTYYKFCDDLIFELILQIHRASKLGYLFYLHPESTDDSKFQIFENNDVIGVFSHLNPESTFSNSSKVQASRGANANSGSNHNNNNLINKFECICPNCERNVAAIRFAPHLEKCMGMGRNSSRIATRRIANYAGDDLDQLIESTGYIQNYSSNYTSTKSQSGSAYTNNVSSSVDNQKTETENKSNEPTGQSDITSIINSVATNKTNENGSSTKAPSAKRMKTKKVQSNQSPIFLNDSSSVNNINNSWQPSASSEDTLSQEAELIKYSGNEPQINFSSTYSVSISPSTNSSSSSLFSAPVIGSNTTLNQCTSFAEPIIEVTAKNDQIDCNRLQTTTPTNNQSS